jgi:hypothetical protein
MLVSDSTTFIRADIPAWILIDPFVPSRLTNSKNEANIVKTGNGGDLSRERDDLCTAGHERKLRAGKLVSM